VKNHGLKSEEQSDTEFPLPLESKESHSEEPFQNVKGKDEAGIEYISAFECCLLR